MTLGESVSIRLNGLLGERKISLYKFCKDSCISKSTLGNLMEGNTKSPGLALIFQIADGLKMTHLEFLDHPVFFDQELDYI